MVRGERDRQVTFLAGSFVIFGAGALYGVRSVLKQHEVKRLDIRGVHRPVFNVAVKALVYGTVLCFGSASFGTGVFMVASGVRSWRDAHELAVRTASQYDFLQVEPTKEVKEDVARINAMTPDEEAEYWSDYVTIAKEALKEDRNTRRKDE